MDIQGIETNIGGLLLRNISLRTFFMILDLYFSYLFLHFMEISKFLILILSFEFFTRGIFGLRKEDVNFYVRSKSNYQRGRHEGGAFQRIFLQ